jgi:hypothetical protein
MLLDEFENLYAEVLAGARGPHVTKEARESAVARFLHENLPRRPGDPRWPWLGEREELQREVESLERKVGALTDRLDAVHRELAQLNGSRVVKIGRLLCRMAGLRMPD